MEISFALIIGAGILYLFYRITKTPDRFPPGHWLKLPILGHVAFFGKDMLKIHTDMRKKYGDIIGTQLGVMPHIILHDPTLAREAFNNPLVSGRPDMPIMNEASGGKKGLIAADGNSWVEQRRFTLRHLRDFGFAKSSMEALIMEEVTEFVETLSKEVGQPLTLKDRFGIVVLNSVWRLVTGQRFSHTDPRLTNLLGQITAGFQETAGGSISFFIPWLSINFPKLTGFEKFRNATKAPFPFYKEQIDQHKKSFQSDHTRDFLDEYIREMKNTTDPNSSFYGKEGDIHLLAVVNDLFLGGSETTSLTLTWLILYLSTYPEVQEKLFQEIVKVVGTSKFPSLKDRPNMPYTEALIAETMRRSSIFPFGIMHNTMEDIEFHGYRIPKDTAMSVFNYGIHHDPKIWGDPDNFRPDRFLDSNGKFQKHEALIPFSVGKRSCPGETFAKDELFLFTTSIFQRFRVEFSPSEPKPSLVPIVSMLLVPEPFKIVLEDRNVSK